VLYGTTANGGDSSGTCTSGCSTVFSLTPPVTPGGVWTETLLHSFQGSDGANPYAPLTVSAKGNLYGAARNGGSSGISAGRFWRLPRRPVLPARTKARHETTVPSWIWSGSMWGRQSCLQACFPARQSQQKAGLQPRLAAPPRGHSYFMTGPKGPRRCVFCHTNEVVTGDSATQLREQGVALLRDVFPKDSLTKLKEAAARCFEAIGTGRSVPERYRFNRFSHSVLLTALTGFGCGGPEELVAPLSAAGLYQLFLDAMGCEWTCSMEQSWVRKKFTPLQAPGPQYYLQNWHQDGALGVRFPAESGPVIPMTPLLTCWIPLDACGRDSPGLEFVRRRQAALLHFTELDDCALRQRFPPQEFWAPVLELGDGLVFLNGTLHRTYTRPEMPYNRLSVEYRIFPQRVSPNAS
jgi:hypothetical protein